MTMNALTSIDFHGDPIWTAELDGAVYVVIKPICERLGIAWQKQLERIKRDAVLTEGITMMVIPSPGGAQETTLLRLDLLNGWLFGIDESRVKDEATRQRVLTYKRECCRVLYEHFFIRAGDTPPSPPPVVETWEADSLSSRIAAVEAARRLYGRAAARDLWPRLGLPQVAPAESPADPAQDRACLDRLLTADLADTAGVLTTVREALAAAWSGDRMMRARLDAAGLRADGGGFWVANRASFLERLFRDTAWAAGGWRFALRRLPGCHGMKHLNNRSIAGMKQRATWVDAALVEHIGT